MITSINEFKKHLLTEAEEAIDPNNTMVTSDDVLGEEQKTQKINAYNSLIKKYNANKNKFLNVTKKDPNLWEKEALKLYQTEINPTDKKKYNNKYLVYEWEIVKIQKQLTTYEESLKLKQEQIIQSQKNLTPEQLKANTDSILDAKNEIKTITDNINKIKKIINDKRTELKTEIQEDLKEINSLK